MSYNEGYLYGSGSLDGSVEAWNDGKELKFESTTLTSEPEDEVEEPITLGSEPSDSNTTVEPSSKPEPNEKEKEIKEEKKTNHKFNLWLPFSAKPKGKEKVDFKVIAKVQPKTSGLSHHFLYPKFTKSESSKGNCTEKEVNKKQDKLITDLDNETMFYLLNFLSVKSLLELKNCNRRFKYLVSQDKVWASRLKWINYSKLNWEEDAQSETEVPKNPIVKPEFMLKKVWLNYGQLYLQFLQLDGPQVYLEIFKGNHLPTMSKKLFKLCNLSKAKFVDSYPEIELNLKIIREYYESALLSNLNIAYTTMDLEELKVYSLALQGLEGDNLGIKWLIEQNPIFVYHNYLAPDSVDDLEFIFGQIDQYFATLFKEVELENQLILKIFDDSKQGNTVFFCQLMLGPLTGYLIPILDTAEEQSDMLPELYPKILVKVLESCLQLLDSVHRTVQIEFSKCHLVLYQLFQPFLDTFVKDELLFLDLNYTTLTKSFHYQQFQQQVKPDQSGGFFQAMRKDKGRMFASVSKVFTKPSYFPFAKRQTHSMESHYDPPLDPMDDPNPTTQTNPPPHPLKPEVKVSDFSQFISERLALQMIQLNGQSLHRTTQFLVFQPVYQCARLVHTTVEKVFNRLISYLIGHHLNLGFEQAFLELRHHQSQQFNVLESNGLVNPVLSFFDLIKVADRITHHLDAYFHKEMEPLVCKDDFLDPSVIAKKRLETAVDGKVAEGLDLSIQTLMTHVHTLLQQHQTAIDFKPGTPLESLQPTYACRQVVTCLLTHVHRVQSADLEPKILEVFYSEIALRLFHDLTKHIKGFTFDVAGGYQLLSDLSGYFSWVVSLDLPHLIPHFQALKEVANLFLLSPENLKLLLQDQERFLGIFHPEDLLEFVQRRHDYKKIQKLVEVDGCCVM